MVYAHRAAYSELVGQIPEGMQVLHKCDNPPCWNPEHLFLGTHQDNVTDKMAKGRYVGISGDRHPNSTLSEADVSDIRMLKGFGLSVVDIAREYGVTRGCIDVRLRRGAEFKNASEPLVRPQTI